MKLYLLTEGSNVKPDQDSPVGIYTTLDFAKKKAKKEAGQQDIIWEDGDEQSTGLTFPNIDSTRYDGVQYLWRYRIVSFYLDNI